MKRPTPELPWRIVLTLAPKDSPFHEDLRVHLVSLVRQGSIHLWSEQSIQPGEEHDQAWRRELERADVFIALLSPDYLADEHCHRLLEQALHLQREGNLRVLPVLLRPCDLTGTEVDRRQLVPRHGQAICSVEGTKRDEAWLKVVAELRAWLPSEQMSLPPPKEEEGTAELEQTYRRQLQSDFEWLELPLQTATAVARISLPLREIYVELKTVARIPAALDALSADERRLLHEAGLGMKAPATWPAEIDSLRLERWKRDGLLAAGPWRRSIHQALQELSEPALIILGDPGSGKTTLLHCIALRLATGETWAAEAATGPATSMAQRRSDQRLPIFVSLAAYEEYLRPGRTCSLKQFLATYQHDVCGRPGLEVLFERALMDGRGGHLGRIPLRGPCRRAGSGSRDRWP